MLIDVEDQWSSYASQIAHDSLFQFDRQFTVHKANEADIDKFKYIGTTIRDSIILCQRGWQSKFWRNLYKRRNTNIT